VTTLARVHTPQGTQRNTTHAQSGRCQNCRATATGMYNPLISKAQPVVHSSYPPSKTPENSYFALLLYTSPPTLPRLVFTLCTQPTLMLTCVQVSPPQRPWMGLSEECNLVAVLEETGIPAIDIAQVLSMALLKALSVCLQTWKLVVEYTSHHGLQCPREEIFYQCLKYKHQYPKKKNCHTLSCVRANKLVTKSTFVTKIRPCIVLVAEVLRAYRCSCACAWYT
jgi:hypothetical protein